METKKIRILLICVVFSAAAAPRAFGMHIMEGFLPVSWAAAWWLLSLPVLALGMKKIKRLARESSGNLFLLATAGAFVFVLSALKLPSVTGSCSHPTGTGLAVVLFGPAVTSVLGSVVLLFQALLLAHGGITTLGANAVSMAVAGPFAGYLLYTALKKVGIPRNWGVFAAAFAANIVTYGVTSLQLALAFPDPAGGFSASFMKFLGIFALTQIPLAISEGLLTVATLGLLRRYAADDLASLCPAPERSETP